jgi:uncharacterized SAM-dependent methyltransferase
MTAISEPFENAGQAKPAGRAVRRLDVANGVTRTNHGLYPKYQTDETGS